MLLLNRYSLGDLIHKCPMNGEYRGNKNLTQPFFSDFSVFFSKSYQNKKIIYNCVRVETYLKSKQYREKGKAWKSRC